MSTKTNDQTMGFQLQHICCEVSIIFLIACSVFYFDLSFGAVHGLLATNDSLIKNYPDPEDQIDETRLLVKQKLPEFNSTDAKNVSLAFSFMESHSTPVVHSFFNSDSNVTEPTHYQHNRTVARQSLLYRLFENYGENGVMTFDGFEQLLKNIGILKFEVKNNDISSRNVTLTVRNQLASNEMLGPESENLDHGSDSMHDHSSHEHLAEKLSEKSDAADLMQRSQNQSNIGGTAQVNSSALNECMSSRQILRSSGIDNAQHLTVSDFEKICPTLVYILDAHVCDSNHGHNDHHDHDSGVHGHYFHSAGGNETDYSKARHSLSAAVWGFSFLACLIISAVGLVAVAIIPIMHQVIYNHLLQFFVALAIGSLSGDALLHLLPHAMIPHVHEHKEFHSDEAGHELEHEIHAHDSFAQRRAIWCGLTALAGILVFFVVERLVGFCSERRRARNDSQKNDFDFTKVSLAPVDERKLRVMKMSNNSANSCEETMMMVHSNKEVRKLADDAHDEMHKNCDGIAAANELNWSHTQNDSNWGHTHVTGGHHHSHDVPESVAAVAWVVIFGDGLHNFADGLAIGSAFANSLTGGLSTSIAVICHELPHELGDFAMLLKTGMSAKKALVYNCVSSILCVFGVILGIVLGNIAVVNPWIFSIIAGMFLYIALVDMLPEMKLVDPRQGEHPVVHFALQLMGMFAGSGIMLLIALYEGQLHLE